MRFSIVSEDRKISLSNSHAAQDRKIPLPNSYAAQVIRRAVLVRLRGSQADDDAVEVASDLIRASWLAQVDALGSLGWRPAQEKRKRLLVRCRRAFTQPDLLANCCGQRAICPGCWGRQVLKVWRRIDRTLFPIGPSLIPIAELPPSPPHNSKCQLWASLARIATLLRPESISQSRLPHLIPDIPAYWLINSPARLASMVLFERVLEYPLPFVGMDRKASPRARSLHGWLAMRLQAGSPASSTDSLQNRAAELQEFKKLGCVGILDVTCPLLDMRKGPAPASEDRGGIAAPETRPLAAGWRAQVRQVFVVPRERAGKVSSEERIFGKPPSVFGIEGTVRLVRRIDSPSRRQVMMAVAWAMAYPKTLLHGPAELALEILRARERRHMITTTGIFRQRDRPPVA